MCQFGTCGRIVMVVSFRDRLSVRAWLEKICFAFKLHWPRYVCHPSEDARLARWQHYRAVRRYCAGGQNLEWSRDMFVRYNLPRNLRNKFLSLMKNEQQWQICCSKQTRALLFATFSFNLQQRINEYFCCATNWSRKVKNAKHRPKTGNETMLRDTLKDFVSYFAAFTLVKQHFLKLS